MKTRVFLLPFTLILLLSAVPAARTVREAAYRYEQIWSTAVRFLRVDSGFPIIEQDKGTGYVLFEYRDAGRVLNGSMELVPKESSGALLVTMEIRIQSMPSYVETMLMDKLVRKLRDEYGDPPAPPRIEAAAEQESTQKRTASKESKEKRADGSEEKTDKEADKNTVDNEDDR